MKYWIASVDDPITKYIPLKEKDPRFNHITIKNLLTMSSGLKLLNKVYLGAMVQKHIIT
jgi:CubicO group peptidase (beta-lactamase class C family)